MNLLKLAAEIQEKFKAGQVALRDLRTLHQYPVGQQMAAPDQLLAAKARGRPPGRGPQHGAREGP